MWSRSGPRRYSRLLPLISSTEATVTKEIVALLELRNLKQIPNLSEGWEVICRNPLEEYIKIHLADFFSNRIKHVSQDLDTAGLHVKGLSASIYFVSR